MIWRPSAISSWLKHFAKQEDGFGTLEFVIVFPVFVLLFSFSVESGLLAARQVMLEHGLDRTVREIRIGTISDPSHENLIVSICGYASIIPDCGDQLRLQMIASDIDGWDGSDLNVAFECRDREEDDSLPLNAFTNTGSNNQLMFLRACALFDPILYVGLGEALEDGHALVASSGYVMEPFQ